MTYVGNTSMEIKVDTYVEHMNGDRHLINRAYLSFVALDENDKPTRVARLIVETDEEKREWERAEKRREIRKMERLDPDNVFNY